MHLEITPQTRSDLCAIAAYIQQDKPRAAKRLINGILDRLEALSVPPELGRSGRVEETREAVLAGTSYIAVYTVASETEAIVRVLHGAQQWPPAL